MKNAPSPMRSILLLLLALLLASPLSAQRRQGLTDRFFLGTNLLSLATLPNYKAQALTNLSALLSNLEYGPSLVAGYLLHENHSAELRASFGILGQRAFVPQVQAAYSFFVLNHFADNRRGAYAGGLYVGGFYVGADLRYWDLWQRTEPGHSHQFGPALNIGHAVRTDRAIFDVRVSQMLGFYSSSSVPGSKGSYRFLLSPLPRFSSFLPMFSLNLHFRL